MPAINENLRLLRQARELTQDDVAKKIGVTRQAISSYESNRTQPNLETLMSLAEVYDVELNDILYGRNRLQMKRRNIKLIAIIAFINLFICNSAQSILIWIANKYFYVENTLLEENLLPMLNSRVAILHAHNAVEVFSMISFILFCIVLLILLIELEHPIPMSVKLKYILMLILGSAITILPWSFCDNIYSLVDYSNVAVGNLLFAVIIFGLSFVGERT